MGNLIGKVVLTGGPGGGKTSALSKIEEELTEKGYKVFIVSESATEMIKGGIKPFGDIPFDIVQFQRLILEYQCYKEKIYEEAVASLADNINCVIIYDRGILDNKAYINQQIFNRLLEERNLSELKVMDNYDMVIHLVTPADGAKEFYTLENNIARTETVEKAIELDKKTSDAWAGHPNLKIIENRKDFNEKLQNVVDEINNLIGEPTSIRNQRKFLIDLHDSEVSFLNENNSTVIHIEQSYLNNNNSEVETRLRKRTYNNQSCYYITLQLKEKDGKSLILKNKKISEKIYNEMLFTSNSRTSIVKDRYSFTIDKQYFKLDIFNDLEGKAILEVDPTLENSNIMIPKGLKVISDVTNDPYYDNHVMSEKFVSKNKKYYLDKIRKKN